MVPISVKVLKIPLTRLTVSVQRPRYFNFPYLTAKLYSQTENKQS